MKHFSILFACSLLIGCGGAEVQRVTGQVLLDDEPLAKMCVLFWPERDVMLGVVCARETNDEGRFDVAPDPERGEGKAGDYIVRVYDPDGGPEELMRIMLAQKGIPLPSKKRLPPKQYQRHETSPLRTRLEPGVNALEPFELITAE